MLIYGRAPQIAANFAAKSTGELSQMTQVLMSAGSVARIFTTMQEGGSPSMIGAYLLSSSMNCIILAQMFMYAGKKKAY
jgi:mannose-P-dolichol utilization defect protein 1